ncbi:MAG: Sulfatase modifying factor 1 precursor (C-alpha-formyglycine- generating enzyme 1) [Candidatus Bipolaricaulis sibiricus]|uniref:Sulfatase modifying factor 1 (C-alpha-formyglycine-generating enzyme 1) n=1 Tax=Bipolaricaulis sibiricus TaxID=2501609 RepID=A0A410FVE8_BIPS1|nr:MAG: Sulfatase modifying factor 1 precursor (C-alpha-formyglycine- generating enzyme 1) [Candidatus Bipolaricaulis sibiricus]
MTPRSRVTLALVLSLLFLVTPGRRGDAAQGDSPPPPEGMSLIPAGSFLMGDSLGEGKAYELPVHEVFVGAFFIDRCEVTKALWDKVATWATGRGYDLRPGDGAGQGPHHPVTHVSWYEAVKWANARSEMEGLTPCYRSEGGVYRQGEADPQCVWTASGYRLPTEAEWEKAARGGAPGLRYPWGNDIDCAHANALGCTGATTPVGSYAPNGYGLYDMVGNVSEWCWDWMHGSYYATSPRTNPTGPSVGNLRVCRGGDKGAAADWCRISLRTYNAPHHESGAIGFRLVRAAP